MPSWKGLRARPAGHRRHGSIVEEPPKPLTSAGERGHTPVGPLEKLSLRLEDSQNDRSFMEESDGAGSQTVVAAEKKPSPEEQPESSQKESKDAPAVEDHIDVPVKPQRFSLLRFRHASDPQLSSTYRNSTTPPLHLMPTPTIITTSPTKHQFDIPAKKKGKHKSMIFGTANSPPRPASAAQVLLNPASEARRSTQSLNTMARTAASTPQHISFDEPERPSVMRVAGAPPAYGDESTSSLAIPISRLSESSRSDGSSGEHKVYAQTTTTHTISTTTTFFRLPRRKKTKGKGPLFPLPVRIPPPASGRNSFSRTPTEVNGGRKSISPTRRPFPGVRFDKEGSRQSSPLPSPTHSTLALTNAPFGSPGPAIVRSGSIASGTSTPSVSLAPPRVGARGRSSTMGSLGRSVEEGTESPSQTLPSGRTSTSTVGRKSFGDIFSLSHRLRQNSEPPVRHGSTGSPGTPASISNSMQIARDAEPELVYPEREESDTPATYLERLEAAVPRGSMATVLCKSSDEFSKTCLRKYMRGFSYFGDSIDIAVRKMLMEVELPKETQQIDRLLAGFADRYHECNPGIFISTDEASIVAFSILLLHSDNHNKNNKRKMQKADYVKNTQGPVQISPDVLECFFDNISYTPFIHFEDEVALNSRRLAAPKLKKSLIRPKSSESLRGPVDPYALILDNKLEALRPSLKDVMDAEDTYSSTGTALSFDAADLHNSFARSGVLQIMSARSRPDAFLTQATITNPAEAQMGLVSIKVAKVGLIWRKDPKKKKAKRPWQEWGAVLTDSKLYFFKDVGWVKKLMQQYEAYDKSTSKRGTLVFKPPLPSFNPDALMSMDDAIALMDSSYKKHKNAFTFIKHGGFEEVFLANSEGEMNDWIAKLNYAATFRTAGVRMRGMMTTPQDVERGSMVRKDSEISTKSSELAVAAMESTSPNLSAQARSNDHQMAWEIMFYRRQIMSEKISDADERLAGTQRELDNLLRNTRHLQILLPFQAKTREALIMAAGRMAAKLKWTRVELWRTKCHRDILRMDLEQEGTTAFPTPLGRGGSLTTTPQKTTPLKTNAHRTNTDSSNFTLSPTSTLGYQPSQTILDRARTPELTNTTSPESPPTALRGRGAGGLDISRPVSSHHTLGEEQSAVKDDTDPELRSLAHQSSIVSSHRSKSDIERFTTPTLEIPDDQLLGVDGATPNSKRPDTSGSEKDRVGAMSPPETMARNRGESVRRSFQRTMRDSHHAHQTPGHHRGKKSRESGSSLVLSEEGVRSLSSESNELKRGTGSFIVHGKKASVVNFGSEWTQMSNEDRLKLRKITQEDGQKTETAVEDGTASVVSGPSAAAVAEAEAEPREANARHSAQFHNAASYLPASNGNFLGMPDSGGTRRGSSSHSSERSFVSIQTPSPRMESVH